MKIVRISSINLSYFFICKWWKIFYVKIMLSCTEFSTTISIFFISYFSFLFFSISNFVHKYSVSHNIFDTIHEDHEIHINFVFWSKIYLLIKLFLSRHQESYTWWSSIPIYFWFKNITWFYRLISFTECMIVNFDIIIFRISMKYALQISDEIRPERSQNKIGKNIDDDWY